MLMKTVRGLPLVIPHLTPKWRNGRRDGLKNRWGQPRVGSTPTFGTSFQIQICPADRSPNGHNLSQRGAKITRASLESTA